MQEKLENNFITVPRPNCVCKVCTTIEAIRFPTKKWNKFLRYELASNSIVDLIS